MSGTVYDYEFGRYNMEVQWVYSTSPDCFCRAEGVYYPGVEDISSESIQSVVNNFGFNSTLSEGPGGNNHLDMPVLPTSDHTPVIEPV